MFQNSDLVSYTGGGSDLVSEFRFGFLYSEFEHKFGFENMALSELDQAWCCLQRWFTILGVEMLDATY